MTDIVVVTPTYNEKDNVKAFVADVMTAYPHAHICFVDDASPDGTGDIINDLARNLPVSVLHRQAKAGIGPAYLAGFRYALDRYPNVRYFVAMDADRSHPSEALRRLVAEAERGASLVVGSRWVVGGGTQNWSTLRRLISRGGSFYARTLLGLPYRDLTAGFVLYERSALERLLQEPIRSNGYCFQIEMKARAQSLGMRIVEVPIVFVERVAGASKMSTAIALEAISKVWLLRRQLHHR